MQTVTVTEKNWQYVDKLVWVERQFNESGTWYGDIYHPNATPATELEPVAIAACNCKTCDKCRNLASVWSQEEFTALPDSYEPAPAPFFLGYTHDHAIEVPEMGEFKVYCKDPVADIDDWFLVDGYITARATGSIVARFAYLDHPTYNRELIKFRPAVGCKDMNIALSEQGYWL